MSLLEASYLFLLEQLLKSWMLAMCVLDFFLTCPELNGSFRLRMGVDFSYVQGIFNIQVSYLQMRGERRMDTVKVS